MGAQPGAVIGDGCRVGGELHRSDQVIRLADGRHDGISAVPVLFFVRTRQGAGILINFHAGQFSQAQLSLVKIHIVNAQVIAGIVKENIAGYRQCLDYVQIAVGSHAQRMEVRHIGVIISIPAPELGGGVDHALLKRRQRHRRLHSRADRVALPKAPVPHGVLTVLVQQQVLTVLGIVHIFVQIVIGIALGAQNAEIIYIQHHHGAGTLGAVAFLLLGGLHVFL